MLICFCFSAYKNRNAITVVASILVGISDFVFAFVKIIIQNSGCKYLKLVIDTCFCFFTCNNYNIGVAVASMSSRLQVPVFVFPLVKIET